MTFTAAVAPLGLMALHVLQSHPHLRATALHLTIVQDGHVQLVEQDMGNYSMKVKEEEKKRDGLKGGPTTSFPF